MKTDKQQDAWKQLLIMTSFPNWDDNPSNVKKRDMLMQELNMPVRSRSKNKGVTLNIQQYLDNRPGLEIDILNMIKQKMTVDAMRKKYPIDRTVFSFVRKKYGLSMKRVDPPSKGNIEKTFKEGGTAKIAEKWKVSKSTVYSWMDSYGIDRPRCSRKLGLKKENIGHRH